MVALDMQLETNESYTKWQPRARQLVDAGHAILDDSERYRIYLEEYQGPRSDTFIQQVEEGQRQNPGRLPEIVEREAAR